MRSYADQYKLSFFLSWIVFYLIYPCWALPVSANARFFVFFALIIYFCMAAGLMSRWFNTLNVNKPLILPINEFLKHLKDNLWLAAICLIAAVLHIYPVSLPILILGDEWAHLQGGLWVYELISSRWHILFQIAFWMIAGCLVLVRYKKGLFGVKRNKSDKGRGALISGNVFNYRLILLIIALSVVYFLLLQNIVSFTGIVRYPPVSKILYFLTYAAFGIDRIFPRVLQMLFYLLCAVYLYRTINLFYEKEAGILGASIYLFLPITFAYAHLGELISGTLFFIIAISFYFIRFIKTGDDRDLLLATYLIGIGLLYKKPVFLMLPVCFIFLFFHKLKKHDLHSIQHFKVLSLALITAVPWMLISKYFTWRDYTFVLSNFTSLDGKLVQYFFLMASNLSIVIFVLFIISAIYVCFFKRNTLTVFFTLVFIVYYFFMVSDIAALSPRFSMTFYPTIAVFLAVFITRVSQNIKSKHALDIFTVILTAYLIVICVVPSINNNFLTIMNRKLHYYPSEEAMRWIKNNADDGEKVLAIRILTSQFYRHKYNIGRNQITDFIYNLEEIATPEKLISFYRKHNMSYIMFPYGPPYIKRNIGVEILEYLKNNTDNEFIEIARFTRGEHLIYIYKLRGE